MMGKTGLYTIQIRFPALDLSWNCLITMEKAEKLLPADPAVGNGFAFLQHNSILRAVSDIKVVVKKGVSSAAAGKEKLQVVTVNAGFLSKLPNRAFIGAFILENASAGTNSPIAGIDFFISIPLHRK